MPSSRPSLISPGWAGMYSRARRTMTVTEMAPRRIADRATSMAVLPPPLTTT
jgi:hypothetical protein